MQKKAYQRKAQAKLAEKRADIDKAKAKATAAGADAQIKAVDELEGKYKAAKNKLEELADAGEDAWEDFAKSFEDSWDDVTGAVKKFFARDK